MIFGIYIGNGTDNNKLEGQSGRFISLGCINIWTLKSVIFTIFHPAGSGYMFRFAKKKSFGLFWAHFTPRFDCAL